MAVTLTTFCELISKSTQNQCITTWQTTCHRLSLKTQLRNTKLRKTLSWTTSPTQKEWKQCQGLENIIWFSRSNRKKIESNFYRIGKSSRAKRIIFFVIIRGWGWRGPDLDSTILMYLFQFIILLFFLFFLFLLFFYFIVLLNKYEVKRVKP